MGGSEEEARSRQELENEIGELVKRLGRETSELTAAKEALVCPTQLPNTALMVPGPSSHTTQVDESVTHQAPEGEQAAAVHRERVSAASTEIRRLLRLADRTLSVIKDAIFRGERNVERLRRTKAGRYSYELECAQHEWSAELLFLDRLYSMLRKAADAARIALAPGVQQQAQPRQQASLPLAAIPAPPVPAPFISPLPFSLPALPLPPIPSPPGVATPIPPPVMPSLAAPNPPLGGPALSPPSENQGHVADTIQIPLGPQCSGRWGR